VGNPSKTGEMESGLEETRKKARTENRRKDEIVKRPAGQRRAIKPA